ncbi:MAG: HEAT repeat domain-containing protein, partial [Myxococcales bacterium]|nr:HEAT repeat domain-containing protein [Myxococcales bacterium]
RQQTFAVPVADRPRFVVVDPAMRVVGEVRVKAPGDMLREQLAHAPSGRGRWLAAQALSRTDDPPTIRALAQAIANEREFWGTRAECAAALGKIRASECFEALQQSRQVVHPKVRRAVLDAIGHFRTIEAAEAIKPHALRDDSYLVEGEAARALGRTRQALAFDVLLDLLERPSWFDVVRAGAIDGLAALRDERAIPHLAAAIRYGHPARVRRASALALPKLSADRKTRETLELLLDDGDPLVRIDAVRALGDLGDGKARSALRERLDKEGDARVRRRIREVTRDLGEPKRATEPLRDELEKLQAEHGELKARLAKLEARLGDAAASPSGSGDATKKRGDADPAKKQGEGDVAKAAPPPRAGARPPAAGERVGRKKKRRGKGGGT